MSEPAMLPPQDVAIPGHFRLVPVGEILERRDPPSWLIEGLLEAGILAQLYGAPESAKSLLAQHMAACTATGEDFFGREAKRGLVVYLCGEGDRGLQRRFRAWEMHFGASLKGAPLVVSSCALSLFDPMGALKAQAAIGEAQSEHGEPLRLVIVDTLARHLAPGNENSQQDMGSFLANVGQLTDGEATVLLIHHTGHGEQTRSRGASSLIGAVDAEYRAEKSGETITLTPGKLKDGDKPDPLAFRLVPADTDLAYEDGSPLNSVILEPCQAPATTTDRLPPAAKLGLATLKEAVAEHGILPPTEVLRANDLGMGQRVVEESFWRDIFYRRRTSESDTPEARKKAFQRVRDKLEMSRRIRQDGKYFWLLQHNGTNGT